MKTITTLLARQGIYNKNGLVHGYELLYRHHTSENYNINDGLFGDMATSSVITQLFSSLDINTIIGNKLAFINFTHNHLVQKIPNLLPKDRIVVEVLETVTIDKPLIDSLVALKKDGYLLALDDFIFNKQSAPLIELADIIKIDVLNFNKQQIAEQLIPLKKFGGKLIAEKIEGYDLFQDCIDLGFDYFQGFFLNKPRSIKGQIITENKTNLLRLLAELSNEEVTLEHVEELVLNIPKLSYRVLRLANSVFLYRDNKIDSLIDALKKVGLNQLHDWICLFMLSSQDSIVPDLLERTLIRAKMCEYLAKVSEHPNPHQAYTVGILSTLDMFLNESLTSLLAKIQLSETLNEAILYQKGELGEILKLTINYEKADFNQLDQNMYEKEDLIQAYLEGINYANFVMGVIHP